MSIKMDLFKELKVYIERNDELLSRDLTNYHSKTRLMHFDLFLFLFMREKLRGDGYENERNLLSRLEIITWYDFLKFMYDKRLKLNKREDDDIYLDLHTIFNTFTFIGFTDEFKEKLKDFDLSLIKTFLMDNSTRNIDGTIYYFYDEIDDITRVIAMNTFIKRMIEDDRYFSMCFSTDITYVKIKEIKETLNKYILNGLSDEYHSVIQFMDTIIGSNISSLYKEAAKIRNEIGVKQSPFIYGFMEYLAQVPMEDNPTRPDLLKDKIKEIANNVG